jgi:hypothetical protein
VGGSGDWARGWRLRPAAHHGYDRRHFDPMLACEWDGGAAAGDGDGGAAAGDGDEGAPVGDLRGIPCGSHEVDKSDFSVGLTRTSPV